MSSIQYEKRFEQVDRQIEEGQLSKAVDNLATVQSLYQQYGGEIGERELKIRVEEVAGKITDLAPEMLEDEESRFAYSNPFYSEVESVTGDILDELVIYISDDQEESLRQFREEASRVGVDEELEAARQYFNKGKSGEKSPAAYSEAWRCIERAEEYADNLDVQIDEPNDLREEIAVGSYEDMFLDAIKWVRFWPNNNNQPDNVSGDFFSALASLEKAEEFADYAGVQFPEELEEFTHSRVHRAIDKAFWAVAEHVDSRPFASTQKLERLQEFSQKTGVFNEALESAVERADEMQQLHNDIDILLRDARDIETEVHRSEDLNTNEEVDDIIGALAASTAKSKLDQIDEDLPKVKNELNDAFPSYSLVEDLEDKIGEIEEIKTDYEFLRRLD